MLKLATPIILAQLFQIAYQFIDAFWLGLPSSIEQSTRSLSLSVTTAFIATFGTLAVAPPMVWAPIHYS